MSDTLELLEDPGLPRKLCPMGSEFMSSGDVKPGVGDVYVWLGAYWSTKDILHVPLIAFGMVPGCWMLCGVHDDGTTVPEVLVVDLAAQPNFDEVAQALEAVFGDAEIAAVTAEIAAASKPTLLRIDPERYYGSFGLGAASERYFTEISGHAYLPDPTLEDLDSWRDYFRETAAAITDAFAVGEISDEQRDERLAWMEQNRVAYERSYGVTL